MKDDIYNRLIAVLNEGVYGEPVQVAWGESQDILNLLWPEIEALIEAVDDLHMHIGQEFFEMQKSTQDFVVQLHQDLHHTGEDRDLNQGE